MTTKVELKYTLKEWFQLSDEKAEQLASEVVGDYHAIVRRLDTYSTFNAPFDKVVDDFNGFNVEKDNFDLEFDALTLNVKHENGGYFVNGAIDVFVPSKNDAEPYVIEDLKELEG